MVSSTCRSARNTSCSTQTKEKVLDALTRVEVRLSPNFGRVLFSLVDVSKGDEVFVELPILISLASLEYKEETLLRRASEQSGLSLYDDFSFLKSYCLSPATIKSNVLDCYVPRPIEVAQSSLLSSLLKVIDICKLYPWSRDTSREELEKVLLIKACNAHGFQAVSATSAALYNLGSKLRHSCCPNVLYTSQRREGLGSFVAKQDIKQGDELFISYIDIFMTCPMREQLLRENYLFTCDCVMCTNGVDRYRGVRCISESFCDGTMWRNQTTKVWTCEYCGQHFSDSEEVLANERIILDGLARADYQTIKTNMINSLARLGPNHAGTKLLQKKYIEEILLPLVSRTIDSSNGTYTEELISLTDEILRWTGDDPSFLDSTLVEIACAVARSNKMYMKHALKYLNLVRADLEDMIGRSAGGSDNSTMEIVLRAIHACETGKVSDVPDLESGNDFAHSPNQCLVQ